MTTSIPIDRVLPNPQQPRTAFDPDELAGLAESIRENGLVQPIVVEEAPDGYFILHDGERRLRAAKLMGLLVIPASVVPPMNGTGAQDHLVRALVANIQRADLNPIEEARGYAELLKQRLTIAEISRKLGLRYYRIEQRLKLLELDVEIQEMIAAGRLSKDVRIVPALMDIPDRVARIQLAQALASRAVTVKTCLLAARKVKESLAAPHIDPSDIPALDIATSRVKQVIDRPEWDALAQVGNRPPWSIVVSAARMTCDDCSLRSIASQKTCSECPAVELIQRLIEGRSAGRMKTLAPGSEKSHA